MEEKDSKIAATYPKGQPVFGPVVRVGNIGVFLPDRSDARTPHAGNMVSTAEIEEIARFFDRSIEETARLLNLSPAPAGKNPSTDQGTASEWARAVRCGRSSLVLSGNEIPSAANTLDSDQLGEIVSFFQVALGFVGGSIGGRSRSDAKIAAARRNGKLGGRPRGSINKVKRRSETNTQSSQHS